MPRREFGGRSMNDRRLHRYSLASFAILLLLVSASVTGLAYAAEQPVEVDGSNAVLQEGGWNQPASSKSELQLQSSSDVQGFQQALSEAIESWDGSSESMTVNIAAYDIPIADFSTLYSGFLNTHGQYFYVKGSSSYYPAGNTVSRVIVMFDTSYDKTHINAFKAKVRRALSGVEAGWNEEQKVLYLHDYLCTHCQYDLTYSKHSAYNALVEGTSVCQGYSEAFNYLLSCVGIKGDIVSSDTLDHAWNLVTVDNKKYYVDCTWDDPSNLKLPSYAGHNNLLRSKGDMATKTDHNSSDWIDTAGSNVFSNGVGDSSTKYDSYYWADCETGIPHVGNLWAYTSSDMGIYTHDYNTGTDKKLTTVDGWPVVGSSGIWNGNFASLSSTGSDFVLADATTVSVLSPTGDITIKRELTNAEKAQGYLYSVQYNDETQLYKCMYCARFDSDPAGMFELDLANHVTGISVSPSQAIGEPGESIQLTANVSPADALEKGATWSIADNTIADIDENGLLTLKKIGNTTVTVTSDDNAHVSSQASVTVHPISLVDEDVSLTGAAGLVYSGKAYEPAVVVTHAGAKLTAGVDYTVSYVDNISAGTATVSVAGMGTYGGTIAKHFNIDQLSLNGATLTIGPATYNGSPQKPSVSVNVGSLALSADDYQLTFSNNTNAGSSALVTVKPSNGNLTGEQSQTFEIAAKSLEDDDITMNVDTQVRYTGMPQVDVFKGVFYNTTALSENDDFSLSFQNNTNAGTATVIATGTGNFTGTVSKQFEITPIDLNQDIDASISEVTYDNVEQGPDVELALKDSGAPISEDALDIAYSYDLEAGTYSVVIQPTNANFIGMLNIERVIMKYSLSDSAICLDYAQTVVYNGQDQTPETTLTFRDEPLVEGVDYTVEYSNNRDVTANAHLVVTGIGRFEGGIDAGFSVTPFNLETATIEITDATYNGYAQEPEVVVKAGDIRIPIDDYAVTYSNNINVGGSALASITSASANVTGAREQRFRINPIDLESADGVEVTGIEDTMYTGSAIEPEPSVAVAGTPLTQGVDFSVTYRNNTEIGTATVTIVGTNNYRGTLERSFQILRASIATADISVGQARYTGNPVSPQVTVQVGTTTLENETDYELTFENNLNAGTAQAVVTGIGNYEGTTRKDFTIEPANLATVTLEATPVTYTGQAPEPSVIVKLGDVTLPESDYHITHIDTDPNVTAEAHYTVAPANQNLDARSVAGGALTGTFSIEPALLDSAQVSLEPATYLYDGQKHEPAVTVTLEGFGVLNEADYGVEYDEATSVGTHDVTIAGSGNFTGSVSGQYKITATKTMTVDGASYTFRLDESSKAIITDIAANGASSLTIPAAIDGYDVGFLADGVLDSLNSSGVNVNAPENSDISAAVEQFNREQADAAAQTIDDLLPDLESVNPTGALLQQAKQAVVNARAVYDGLTPAQKQFANDAYSAITQTERKITELEKQADNLSQANRVIALINNLPSTVSNDEQKVAVESARQAFNKLTPEQKALIDDSTLKKLSSSEQSAEEYSQRTPSSNPIVGTTVTAGQGASAAQYRIESSNEVQYCKASVGGTATAISIPASITISGKSYAVTSIANNACKGNATLKTVTIAKSVKSIGANAFAKCPKLARVKGGSGIVTIGSSAFLGCKSLKTFTWEGKVTKVGKKAFFGCKKLSKLVIKTKKLKTVGKAALKKTPAKMKVKVPKAKKKTYKKKLVKAGMSKRAKVK